MYHSTLGYRAWGLLVYLLLVSKGNAMVTVHVDDMAAAASNLETLSHTITELRRVINVIDMGPIKRFLSMNITRDRAACTISLSQGTYINTILKQFNMTESYGVSTPLDPNVVLSTAMSPTSDEEKVKMGNVPYLSGVGSLMYASMAT